MFLRRSKQQCFWRQSIIYLTVNRMPSRIVTKYFFCDLSQLKIDCRKINK